MNRSQMKYLAAIFMVIDNVFLRFPGFSAVLHLVTRFVAPLFAWLMVDGFFKTSSRKNYCMRLWIATILMQLGNELSFALFEQNGITDNIFLTLALGFTNIWLLEISKTSDKKILYRIMAIALTIIAMLMGLILYIPLPFGSVIMVEGGLPLIPFILFSYFYHDDKKKVAAATVIYNIYLLFTVYGGTQITAQGFEMFCINSDWMTFLVIPFIFLDNGEQGKKNSFNKWFFYLFYPLHLWILAILNMVI